MGRGQAGGGSWDKDWTCWGGHGGAQPPPPSFSGLGWGGREMINPSPDAWQCPPPSPHLWGNS